jgi:hypothetical protein
VLSLGKLLLSPYPINDFHLIECVAIGLGMKSRLPIDDPGVWLASGAGWAFLVLNQAQVVVRAALYQRATNFYCQEN